MEDTVGNRIEALAAQKGLPGGKELAALFGVSYETLRRWRGGGIAPNRNRAARISEVLGVPEEVFMHGVVGTPQLDPQQRRLLRAFGRVLAADKERFIGMIELRAQELSEIAQQMLFEQPKKK